MLVLSLLHLHIVAWLIVGASVALFALAGTAIDRFRPVRTPVKRAQRSQDTPRP